jgi:hypothetical protein
MNTPPPAYGAIYHDEGSQYWHTTQNAFCNVATQWLLLNHGLDIVADRNFTTNPQYSAQGNSINATIANNPTVGSCAELPASHRPQRRPPAGVPAPRPEPADRRHQGAERSRQAGRAANFPRSPT